MRTTLCAVALLVARFLLAQDTSLFAEPSAFWYVANTHPAGTPVDPGFTATTTRRYWIENDSLVGGELWSVFVSGPTHNGGEPQQIEGLVRQEGDIVLSLRDDMSTDTLYDFSLSVGDSTHYLIDGWYSTWLHAIAVDSVLVGGGYRHTLLFDEPQLPPDELRECWIEGIGSIHGPLFPGQARTFMTEVPGDSLMLTCFGIDQTVLWNHPGYETCEVNILLGLDEQVSAARRLHPNPGSDHFTIPLEHSEGLRLEIFDATGRAILHDLSINGSTVIDASTWSKGVFQILVREKHGLIRSLRWVKL